MATKVLAGRYELFERIGEGGMSVVYKAKDKLLNRFVAIKILKPQFINDHKFIDSFRRESQAAASLSHPNIVNIYDVGREGNIHYIVMELIEGKTLSDYIHEQGPMAYPKVIILSKQIAAALSFAHKNHIIHRDVKPHNIMITPSGTAKITDFGIAKAVNAATIVDNTEGIIGSVHYFSPEQARGGYVDEKSDIYSLGIVMYEMLTGRVPFDGDNPVNIALMHINGEMVPPSKLVDGVPPALEHIIMKCTDKYPVNRFTSADELIEALNNLEFVGSVVGNSVLMGGNGAGAGNMKHEPVAQTDYDDGEDYDEDEKHKKHSKSKNKNKHMDKKKKLIIICAAVAAVLILGIVIAAAAGLFGGKDVEVKSFKGMTVTEAKNWLKDNKIDLNIKEGRKVVSEDVEAGKIVSQNPKEGEKVKEGSTITVYVSKGKGEGSVPDLTGSMESEAQATLEAAGFTLGDTKYEASEEEKGTIIRQSPDGGTNAEKGSKVTIYVSDGSKSKAIMPYLVGKTIGDAKSALSNAGLKMGDQSYDYSTTYAEGEVMWQQYDANAQLDKGTTVRVRVSRGPEPTTPSQPDEPSGPDDEDD